MKPLDFNLSPLGNRKINQSLSQLIIMLQYDEVFFRQTAPEAMPGHVGADGLKKPPQIITLSFSEVLFQVEVQAKYI